jgi:hypothetical protein
LITPSFAVIEINEIIINERMQNEMKKTSTVVV